MYIMYMISTGFTERGRAGPGWVNNEGIRGFSCWKETARFPCNSVIAGQLLQNFHPPVMLLLSRGEIFSFSYRSRQNKVEWKISFNYTKFISWKIPINMLAGLTVKTTLAWNFDLRDIFEFWTLWAESVQQFWRLLQLTINTKQPRQYFIYNIYKYIITMF